jgi:outer membrane protein assembly factor BamE
MRWGAVAVGLALALAGCKQAPELPTLLRPYKIDVQQGNVITQEMLSKLKAGMTRSQVRFVLGSPLVVDPFRTDRWDYVSRYEKQGREVERRHVTVIFEDEKLVRIEGDVALSDGSLAVEKPAAKPAGKAPVADKPPAKAAAPVEPAKPAAVTKPAVAKPEPAVAAPAAAGKPQPNTAETAKSDVAKPEATPAAPAADPADSAATLTANEEKKADAAKKDAPADKPKQPGFFGRMLDKLGI